MTSNYFASFSSPLLLFNMFLFHQMISIRTHEGSSCSLIYDSNQCLVCPRLILPIAPPYVSPALPTIISPGELLMCVASFSSVKVDCNSPLYTLEPRMSYQDATSWRNGYNVALMVVRITQNALFPSRLPGVAHRCDSEKSRPVAQLE